ncbi:MAG: GNAT family N-acetyltransferase [Kiritimatiellia bacterium]|nr:GNAT family N-acetyltransferase [Lentisphaerota bacterium]
MKIRPLQNTGEMEALRQVIRATEMFTEEEEKVALELMDIFLTQPDQRDYIVEVLDEEDGALAGYVCYGPTPMTEGTYDLYWIAVHPRTQRRGYGRALLERVESLVAQRHGRLVLIETSSQEKYLPTRQFYLRAGYQEQARIPDFYRPGDDRIIYCRYLQCK